MNSKQSSLSFFSRCQFVLSKNAQKSNELTYHLTEYIFELPTESHFNKTLLCLSINVEKEEEKEL
jgi:hypothetical protein